MSDDSDVALAFAGSHADATAGVASIKPIRLSIDLIGQVGLKVGGGRVSKRKEPIVVADASATTTATSSFSSSSAVTLAQAAIDMTTNPTAPINTQRVDTNARVTSPSATPERVTLAVAIPPSTASPPSSFSPSSPLARARVHAILLQPSADWSLVHVQQQLKFSPEDKSLLPFVTVAMVCEEMKVIVQERKVEAEQRAAVAAEAERKEEAKKLGMSSTKNAVNGPSAVTPSTPLIPASASSARVRVHTILSHPYAAWTLVYVQQQLNFTREDRDLLPFVTKSMVCEVMESIVAERQQVANEKAAIAAAAEVARKMALSPSSGSPGALPVASAAVASSSSSSSSSLSPVETRVRAILAEPHAHCSLAHVQQQMKFTSEDKSMVSLVTGAMVFEQMQSIVHERQAEARQRFAVAEVAAEKERQAASLIADRKEQERIARVSAASAALAAQMAALSESIALNPTPLPPMPIAIPNPIVHAVAPVAAAATWTCNVCTFLNTAPMLQCEVCLSLMPEQEQLQGQAQPSPRAPAVVPVQDVRVEAVAAPSVSVLPPSNLVEPVVAPVVAPVVVASPVEVIAVPIDSPLPESIVSPILDASSSPISSNSPCSSNSSLTDSCSAFTSSSNSAVLLSSPTPHQMDVQQLAEQMERLSQQLRALQSPSVDSSSLHCSLSSSSFLPSPTPMSVSASLSPSELASAVAAMNLTMANMAEMQRAHLAQVQRIMAEQMEQTIARMKAEQRTVKRERSNSIKSYRSVGSAIAHRNRRSMSGTRTQRSTSSLSSSQTSPQSGSALSSASASPLSSTHTTGAAVPSLSLASASSDLNSSLVELESSRYINLMSLSSADLVEIAEQSVVTESEDSAVLPTRAPCLQTINSASEMENMEEKGRCSHEGTSAPSLTGVLSAIPQVSVTSSSSFSSSSSSSSSPLVDLSASADLCDIRFPSVPDMSDRDTKLDELARLGFNNRIFASTLLDMNAGCMATTIANLTQFYGR